MGRKGNRPMLTNRTVCSPDSPPLTRAWLPSLRPHHLRREALNASFTCLKTRLDRSALGRFWGVLAPFEREEAGEVDRTHGR